MRTGLIELTLASLLVAPSINATELVIPDHSEGSQQVMPKRGISMEAVLGKFGEPDQRFGPVGEPPITEWIYDSFRVYFEHRTVLHSIDLNTLILPGQ
ncbi:MAG: hypothetical protein ACI9YO_001825 [Gammaproteobacteria bacterium]|jgi:hypothetical protein